MRRVFIKTYGCQMNFYDSSRMSDMLLAKNSVLVDDITDADIVLYNTCHIREKAAEKVYSELSKIKQLKKDRRRAGGNLTLILAGCTAQAEGEQVFERAPYVDIVVGPQSYHTLPKLLEDLEKFGSRQINLNFEENKKFDDIERSEQGPSVFLSVQEGCDKFCHFCVVPYTRGAEFSRPANEVYREALLLISSGAKELTLLGQNVSAYHSQIDNVEYNLGKLVEMLAGINGLERIRYVTSHPIDMHESGMLHAHKNIDKLMPFLHLPIQSGSNRILKKMNRKHSREFYLSLIEEFRAARSDMAFSSDFIVGYPEESNEDFMDTVNIVNEVKYSQCYSFKYSQRPGTPAASIKEQVSEDVKAARLSCLQDVLLNQQLEFNQSVIGKSFQILLQKVGKYEDQLVGKSPYMQSVVVNKGNSKIGDIITVKVVSAHQNSLYATRV